MENFEDSNDFGSTDCEYTDEMPVRSIKHGDTLATATKKVIAQLQANCDHLAGVCETLEVPATYKEAQGAYFVGIKYSNKYVACAFNAGQNKFAKVKSKQACIAKLREAIASVQAGQCDAALKAAIAANIAAHNKRKANK